jgi:hypothetical protein
MGSNNILDQIQWISHCRDEVFRAHAHNFKAPHIVVSIQQYTM